MPDFLKRSTFLSASAATGLATAASAQAQTMETPSPEIEHPCRESGVIPIRFDRAAFAASLAGDYAHRQVAIGISVMSATSALQFIEASHAAYSDPDGFGTAPNALHAVTVFYGGTSPLIGLDDAMWKKYPLVETVNVYAEGKRLIPGYDPGAVLLEQLATYHNAAFYLCNAALSGLCTRVLQTLHPEVASPSRADREALHAEFRAHLMPGVMLVPSGVAALNALQEARYTLIPPSA